MLDIDISQMEIAHRLKETVNIQRVDTGDEKIVESGKYVDVATGVEIVILPSDNPNRALPTGEVVIQNQYEGYMLTPNRNIVIGDIVVRDGLPNLHVLRVYNIPEKNPTIQYFDLDENLRS